MSEVKEFLERETGEQLGLGVEFTFDELGLSKSTLAKSAGKVGLKARLTEFLRAAQSRSGAENPIAPNQADVVKWLLYDRFQFAAGTTVPNNFKFFTQPIGTAGKTKVDTNLDQVQRLPDPLWFNTEGVGFYFNGLTLPTDIENFFNSEYMEFWVGQKVYLEGPIQVFPGGAGLYGALAAGATFSFMVSNGHPRFDNIYDVRLPAGIHLGVDATNTPIVTDGLIGITILQGQQFRIEMNAPLGGAALTLGTATPPGAGLSIMAYLHGILSRGVQ